MKRFLVVVMMIVFVLGMAAMAYGAGNFYIPGSRDLEGGLGEDGKSFEKLHVGNRVVFEGETSDAYEAILICPDPGSDITYTLPATSGTLSLVGGAGGTLGDGKLYIGNATDGLAAAQTVSGIIAITNAGVTSGTLADTKIWIGNSAGTAMPLALSGDGTLANTGALTLSANSVSVSQAFINTVTLLVANAGTFNSVTVDSGHVLLSYYLTTIGGINGANLLNDIAYDGAGVWTMAMANALVGGDAVWTLNFLSDN